MISVGLIVECFLYVMDHTQLTALLPWHVAALSLKAPLTTQAIFSASYVGRTLVFLALWFSF